MMNGSMARRAIIFGGSAFFCAAALSTYAVCNRKNAGSAELDRLMVALLDISFRKRIASDHRHFRTKEELANELLSDSNILAALEISCPTSRRTYLRNYSQEQFKAGKCLVADRIVVSRSELLISTYFGSAPAHEVVSRLDL